MNLAALSKEEMASVFIPGPDDYPTVHVERAILMPAFYQRMGLVHLAPPGEEIPKLIYSLTGCDRKVSEKECSLSPKKVTCVDCRAYAARQHRIAFQMLEYLLGSHALPIGVTLRDQLQALTLYHMGHTIAFEEPFTVPKP